MRKLLPKTAIGSLHLEFKRCGRGNCRCRQGYLHGPYVYKHWREEGRQKKQYVPMRQFAEVALEIMHKRAELIRPSRVKQALRAFNDR